MNLTRRTEPRVQTRRAGRLSAAEIERVTGRYRDAMHNLALQTREFIFSVRPEVIESLYHGALCYGMTEGRASLRVYIALHRDHVNLGFYYGASLPKADTCLVGEGKRMRHIKLHSAVDIPDATLRRLVRAALPRLS
jgi:hypothetical protein